MLDKKTILGIGIGIIIATSLMAGVNYNKKYTDAEIEKRAREMGMEYNQELKVINKDVKK